MLGMRLVHVVQVLYCGWRGGEWMRGLGFTIPLGTGGVLDVCLFFWLRWCRWGLGPGS